jgi:hypothetical protein
MTKDQLLKLLRPVTLGDKPLFDRFFSRYPPTVSELTFTNVLSWAEVRHHLFCEHQGHLLISYRGKDCCLSFYPPVGPQPAAILGERIQGLREYCWTRLDGALVASVGAGVRPVLDRDNSDYVYRLADLRELRGKEFHAKRNYLKRFAALHPEVRPLTSAMTPDCVHVQEQWLENEKGHESARIESSALIKALHHFDELGLRGVGVFVEGRLVAFAVGEPLNPSTFVEHFEKALAGYTGVYQYLLHQFALSIPPSFAFLNREQDLGVEGLRRAKESWHPAFLLEKYTLKVRGNDSVRRAEPRGRELAGSPGT